MENRHTFKARLVPFFSKKKQLDIQLAYTLAKFGHRAQTRKELVDGKPIRYFEHVRSVAIIVMDEMKIMDRDMIISALLHDCLEDTDTITDELIENSFGEDVVEIVKNLSKVPKENYMERLENCSNWKVLALKACDRLHNLRTLNLPDVSKEFKIKQINETTSHYIHLFEKLFILAPKHYVKNISVVTNQINIIISDLKKEIL